MRPRGDRRPHLLLGAAVVAVIGISACGGGGGSSSSSAPATTQAPATSAPASTSTSQATTGASQQAVAQGKQIFESVGCTGCHTLKDAGSNGTVGPNLDDLKPDMAAVVTQVTNGGAGMPAFKGQLNPAQIKAVATYVSSVAGQ